MKEFIALCLALVLALSVAGCSDRNMTFDIENATKIEVKSGLTGDDVIIEDGEFVKGITENFNSLTFEKMGKVDAGGYAYILTWMDETDSKVASIAIPEENGCQISYDGYYYRVGADLAIDMQPILETLKIAHSSSPAPDPDNNTDTDTVLQEPPNLTLSVNGQEGIKTFRGTYSWTVLNEDGTSFSMEADSMQVLEAKEEMTPVMLDPKPGSLYGVTLNFELAPDKVIVHRWSGEFWNKPYVNGEIVEVECVEPAPISGYTGSLTPTYMFILKDGNYIYEAYAEWNNSGEYQGSAYYGFYTSTNDE